MILGKGDQEQDYHRLKTELSEMRQQLFKKSMQFF